MIDAKTRALIALHANSLGGPGAPTIHSESTSGDIGSWLAWNDGDAIFWDERGEECDSSEAFWATEEDAWHTLASVLGMYDDGVLPRPQGW